MVGKCLVPQTRNAAKCDANGNDLEFFGDFYWYVDQPDSILSMSVCFSIVGSLNWWAGLSHEYVSHNCISHNKGSRIACVCRGAVVSLT